MVTKPDQEKPFSALAYSGAIIAIILGCAVGLFLIKALFWIFIGYGFFGPPPAWFAPFADHFLR